MKRQLDGRFPFLVHIVLIVAPLLTAGVAITLGSYGISLTEFFNIIKTGISGMSYENAAAEKIVWGIRLPRVLLAILIGGGLSTAGVAFQSLFANPLATPDTLGVASGASFGAVLGLLLGFSLVPVQLMAFAAGIISVALTYITGSGRQSDGHSRRTNTVVLAGIIIGSLFTALLSLLKYLSDPQDKLPEIEYWLMGSLSSAGYESLILGAPPIIIGCLVIYIIRWRLNLLPLDEDEVRSTGTNIRIIRAVTVLCATMITAACVSMCGQVGWVGLLVPHICRMLFGSNNMKLVPAAISIGAVFMLIVDTAARTVTTAEIPVSILTALIGAPVFIVILKKSGGWSL